MQPAKLLVLAILLAISPFAFSDTPAAARKQLVELRIPYATNSMLNAIADNDVVVAGLLADAGLDLNQHGSFNGAITRYVIDGLPPADTKLVKAVLATNDPLAYAYFPGKVSVATELKANAVGDFAFLEGSPLMLAAALCRESIIDRLIAGKADPNAVGRRVDTTSDSALSLAVGSGCVGGVRSLLDAGAQVSATSPQRFPYVLSGLTRGGQAIAIKSPSYREQMVTILSLLESHGLSKGAVEQFRTRYLSSPAKVSNGGR